MVLMVPSQWNKNGGRKKQQPRLWLAVYQATTIGNVSQTDRSVVLHHHARIDEILKWTKEHLDAWLASAEVIIDNQRDEPG
jgi:hypothetical protein